MQRRGFLMLAAGSLLLPRTAGAQQAKRRRIAFLALGSPSQAEPNIGTFRQGLRALGYGDEDIAIEIRYADGKAERLSDLAAELVHLAPEVIIAGSTPTAQAAKQATSVIPIVMIASGDPVGVGLVASLAHPGGNVTGLSTVAPEMAGKWLDLLKTAIPGAERVAILFNPRNSQQVPLLQAAQQAARTLRTELVPVEASAADEIDGAFATMARQHAEALIVTGEPMFFFEKTRIVELAASHKLPAIYQWREFATVGGLMSYGPDLNDLLRRRFLCRQDLQRRQAGRPAGRAADQIRAGGQSEDGAGARPVDPAIDPRRRRRGDRVTRRDFVAFVTCAVSLVAVAARAQQKAMPLIGWLGNSSPAIGANSVAAFRQGLGEIGYVEGQNVAFEYRWAEDHYERLPALADDLARLKVDLIVSPRSPTRSGLAWLPVLRGRGAMLPALAFSPESSLLSGFN